jgi:catechol 2,3-dioxygenase-like lactoylglutathione lyase family enzyme
MQLVNKLAMFHMAVTNMDAAKEFYADKLGLKVTNDKAFGDKRWISLELPGGGTSINLTTEPENLKPGTMKLYLSSSDVEASYKELISKGVKPSKEIADDWGKWDGESGKWFELSDPDGNRLLIIPA